MVDHKIHQTVYCLCPPFVGLLPQNTDRIINYGVQVQGIFLKIGGIFDTRRPVTTAEDQGPDQWDQ